MNLGEQLLSALALYGIPLLCAVTVVASAGAPLPVSLLLIAAGSFADHGEMSLNEVIGFATLCAVMGDNIGFAAGRWGGRKLAQRVSRWTGSEARLAQAEDKIRKWGATGVFLTRWLFTPFGPLVNLVSGFAGYPWTRFLVWDLLGELLWVLLYVMAGKIFSHQVQVLNSFLGNMSWALLAFSIAVFLGWKLRGFLRSGAIQRPQAVEKASI